MAIHADPHAVPADIAGDATPVPDLAEINDASMKGWKWFSNFLLWNVISTVGALLLLGLCTVWS